MQKINNLESQIVNLKNTYDKIKIKCTSLEIQAERLRTDMGIAEGSL